MPPRRPQGPLARAGSTLWIVAACLAPIPVEAQAARPSQCPSTEEVEAVVQRVVGRPLADLDGVRLQIEPAPQGVRVTARLGTSDAPPRRWEGPAEQCRAFVSAAIVVVGLWVADESPPAGAETPAANRATSQPFAEAAGDSDRVAADQTAVDRPRSSRPSAALDAPQTRVRQRVLESPRTPARGADLERVQANSQPWQPELSRDNPPRLRFAIGAGAMVEGLSFPDVGVGPSLSMRAHWDWFDIWLTGAWLPPRTRHIDGEAGGRFEGGLVSARFCPVATFDVLQLGGCAGPSLGYIQASGVGVDEVDRAEDALLSADLSALMAISPVPWLRLVVAPTLAIALIRRVFVLDGIGTVHQSEPITFRVWVGLELAFDSP